MEATPLLAGVTSLAESRYKAQVAKNNAEIADRNAKESVERAAIEAQNNDIDAAGEIGQAIAVSGASGLTGNVGSMGLRVENKRKLAARDRAYRIYEGDREAHNFRQQKADYEEEARNIKRGAIFNAIGAGINVGSSLIGGASMTNKKNTAKLG